MMNQSRHQYPTANLYQQHKTRQMINFNNFNHYRNMEKDLKVERLRFTHWESQAKHASVTWTGGKAAPKPAGPSPGVFGLSKLTGKAEVEPIPTWGETGVSEPLKLKSSAVANIFICAMPCHRNNGAQVQRKDASKTFKRNQCKPCTNQRPPAIIHSLEIANNLFSAKNWYHSHLNGL